MKLEPVYRKNKKEITDKIVNKGNERGTQAKKLLSLFRIYDYDKQMHVPSMHIYNRNLSPLRENVLQCSTTTPY